MRRLFLVLAVLAAGLMLLAACGPGATPTAAPTQAPTTAATEAPTMAATEAPTTAATEAPAALSGIVRVGSWDAADGLKPWDAAIASFEAAYPGVDVQLESVPQDYGTKLLAQFASGTAPDVFQIGDGDVAKRVADGVLEPLDPYISGEKGTVPLDTSVFYPAIADIGKVEGSTYLFTKDYSPLTVFYNKDLFDAAGVSYPAEGWTQADFLDAAQKLTVTDGSGNISQWGAMIPDGWGDWVWDRGILPIIYQNGGDIMSPDGTKASGYLDSDATVEALQWYADLFTKYKVAPTKADVAALSGQDLFATGKVAMMWSGIWNIPGYQKDHPELNFGMAELPKGKQPGNSICWAGFGLYNKSQNKDAAWAFLRWIGADKGAEEFAKYALTDVKPIAEAQGKNTDPYYAPIMADLANVKPLPDFRTTKYGDCVATPFKAALEEYLNSGEGDLKAMMTQVAADADACLAQP